MQGITIHHTVHNEWLNKAHKTDNSVSTVVRLGKENSNVPQPPPCVLGINRSQERYRPTARRFPYHSYSCTCRKSVGSILKHIDNHGGFSMKVNSLCKKVNLAHLTEDVDANSQHES